MSVPRPTQGASGLEWIESPEAFAALAPEWDAALEASGVDDPFLTAEFLACWWRHFGAGRALRIAVVRKDGELRGGLPLYAEELGRRRWLRFPGAEDFAVANRTDLLCPAGLEEVASAVAEALAERDDWDFFELPRVHRAPAEVDALVRAFERAGLLLRHRQSLPRYLIEVPGRPEDFLRAATKNLRKKLARARRAAEEFGELRLVEVHGEREFHALFARYVELSRTAFHARGGRSTFEDETLVAFFDDLLVRFEGLGLAHAHALELGGRPIAISFGYSLRGELNDVLSTYDARRPELSPGLLMTWEQLVLASRRGSRVLDFATGHNPHKERWATRTEPVAGLVFERSSPVRRLRRFARRGLRALFGRGSH